MNKTSFSSKSLLSFFPFLVTNQFFFFLTFYFAFGFPAGSVTKNLPAMKETLVQCLGQENLMEGETATQCSILAWKIPWTGEPGGLQSMGSQRVGLDLATKTTTKNQLTM